MFGFCWHRWHVINKYANDTIRTMAENPGYDPDLDDYGVNCRYYKEKICLKCEKYVDEITPRFEHHQRGLLKHRHNTDRVKQILSKLKRSKKVWEELLPHGKET